MSISAPRHGRNAPPRVAVLMPTFEQAAFIGRALASLVAQSFEDWELAIVDDGLRDGTMDVIVPWLADSRIRYQRLNDNRGLGAALNSALNATSAPLVAYLRSDDVYYRDHLATLVARLQSASDAVLAFSHVRHHYSRVIGVFCDGLAELGARLRDEPRMTALRANVWRHRDRFTFDHHVDRLVAFFREVIAAHRR